MTIVGVILPESMTVAIAYVLVFFGTLLLISNWFDYKNDLKDLHDND